MFALANPARATLMLEFRFDNPLPAGFPSSGPPQTQAGATWTRGDLSVTATCAEQGNDGCSVTQNAEGLGVRDHFFDSSNIDGLGDNEQLILTWSRPVKILRIDFERVGRYDESALIIDGVLKAAGYIKQALGIPSATATCAGVDDGLGGTECEISLDLVAMNFVGTRIAFGDSLGLGFSLDPFDSFRVESIVAMQVPEPGSLALMAVGFSGLGVIFRHRRRRPAARRIRGRSPLR
ncbi:MAG: PEP-CTERM sorting domain-containing protein [Kiloniellaceae bacterium]